MLSSGVTNISHIAVFLKLGLIFYLFLVAPAWKMILCYSKDIKTSLVILSLII